MAVRDGVVLYAQPGALPAAALEDLISQVRAVDMDEVRREVAQHEAAQQEAAQQQG
jgi:thioredoxin 1